VIQSPPISLVVVTRDEERNIARCLDAADFCAERLVVDSGSTDRTVEIARERGARVLTRDWTGYGDQKNFGVAEAAHEWVLCLDADEVVTPELRASILAAFRDGEPDVDAFEINRHGIYAGRLINHSGWYPEWRTFLYRRDRARWAGREPHPYVAFDGRMRRRLDGDRCLADHVAENRAEGTTGLVVRRPPGAVRLQKVVGDLRTFEAAHPGEGEPREEREQDAGSTECERVHHGVSILRARAS